MERRYCKIVYEPFYHYLGDIEAAIAAGEYTKTYYLDGRSVGRVDLYTQPEGLFKVSYRGVAPPYDIQLAEHRLKYPGALCEFWTQPIRSSAGLWVVQSVLYEVSGEVGGRSELHLDDNGWPVREIELGPAGQPVEETQRVYNEAGVPVLFRYYDAAGKLLRESSHDDWA